MFDRDSVGCGHRHAWIPGASGVFRHHPGDANIEKLLEPDSWRMHSLRTITNLAHGNLGQSLWFVICATVIAIAGGKSCAPAPGAHHATGHAGPGGRDPSIRTCSCMTPQFLCWHFSGWERWSRANGRPGVRHTGMSWYFLFVFFLVPTARLLYVQFSVPPMAWLFWRVAHGILNAESARYARDLPLENWSAV